jgi:pentatricopeptide repeat protein
VRSYSSSCSASAVGSNTKGQIIRERSSPPAPAHPTFLAHAPPALDINLSKQLQPGSSAAPPEPEPTTTLELSKKELLELLDPYDGGEVEGVDEHLRFFRDPYMRGYAPPDEAAVTVARTQDDYDFPSAEEVTPGDREVKKTIFELTLAVNTRLSGKRDTVDLDRIYEIYKRLPEPRIPYLLGRFRHRLLKALGQPAQKNSKSMLRYFAVLADVKNCGIAVSKAEWNCAISFASRYVAVSTEAETESALKLWREMEVGAGIKATDVTFNILFDVASKAGNFTLAEMIYREMENRGHRPNRYHYVSLIHFFGLKMDSGGIRAAYAEMVNAGEMIDTVALNAVLSGLLRSGEEVTAENTYERMKSAALQKTTLPARNYASDQAITKALMMFAKLGRKFKPLQPNLQRITPIHPNLNTYFILVSHYGTKLGDLQRVAKFLDEMKLFQIPLHGSIFLCLFKSFTFHGGYPGSPWSLQRLDSIWQALLDALDDGTPGIEINTFLGHWVLSAFNKCSDSEAVLNAYEQLKERWQLSHEDEQYMVNLLYRFARR